MEWYGLNDSVVSIMDGGNLGLPFVKDSTHCDNLTGPATYDINRVHEYFRDGNLTEFDVQRVAGDYQAIISWKDEAWAEFNHELYFFYRLDGQGTDTFDRYYTYPYTERVGVHEDIARDPDSHRSQSQTMRQSINTTVHRAGRNYVLPDYTGYAACGRAYFSQFESRSSTLRCTNEILISNADHNEQFTSTSTPTATPTSTPTPTATTTPTATPEPTPTATPEPTPPPPNDKCYYEPELPQCNDGYE